MKPRGSQMGNACGRRVAPNQIRPPAVATSADRAIIGLPSREALEFVATLMRAEIFVISHRVLGVRTHDAVYWVGAS